MAFKFGLMKERKASCTTSRTHSCLFMSSSVYLQLPMQYHLTSEANVASSPACIYTYLITGSFIVVVYFCPLTSCQVCFGPSIRDRNHPSGRNSGLCYNYVRRSHQQDQIVILYAVRRPLGSCLSSWCGSVNCAAFQHKFCSVIRLPSTVRV